MVNIKTARNPPGRSEFDDTVSFLPSIPPRPEYSPPAFSSRHSILIKHNPANRPGVSELILPYLNLFSTTDLLGGIVCFAPRSYDIHLCHAGPYIGWMTNVTRSKKQDHPQGQEAKDDFLSHNILLTNSVQKLCKTTNDPTPLLEFTSLSFLN
jgi:hypothetical protein